MKNGKHNYSVDYIKLFLRREGRIVLGKNLSNVWLLTLVLTATFLAIAFSNGSLIFLEDKMKDPFINWVDIKNNNQDKDFDALEEELVLPENAETYHYKGVEYGYEFGYFFYENESEDIIRSKRVLVENGYWLFSFMRMKISDGTINI